MPPLLLDIHTHRPPAVPGTALVSVSPEAFCPQPGGYYSVGLHPWQVDGAEGDEAALAALHRLVCHPQVLAVGEAGLDRLRGAPLAVQQPVFARQARLAEEAGKPLIIHLVRAVDELLALRRSLRPRQPWVVHGFRGGRQQAGALCRHGFFLSFGAHCRDEALQAVPADRFFIETDESPEPIEALLTRAATLRGVKEEVLRRQLAENAARCFRLFFSAPFVSSDKESYFCSQHTE